MSAINRFSSRRQRLDHAFLSTRLRGARSYRRISGYCGNLLFLSFPLTPPSPPFAGERGRDLIDLKSYKTIRIINASEFLRPFE